MLSWGFDAFNVFVQGHFNIINRFYQLLFSLLLLFFCFCCHFFHDVSHFYRVYSDMFGISLSERSNPRKFRRVRCFD